MVALAVFGVSATLASAAADPWAAARKRLSYPIYEPMQTLGHKVHDDRGGCEGERRRKRKAQYVAAEVAARVRWRHSLASETCRHP